MHLFVICLETELISYAVVPSIYGGLEVQNKSQFWKQNNKLQTQMQI